MAQQKNFFGLYLILIIVIAFLAGILGQIFFQTYLTNWSILKPISIPEPQEQTKEIVIEKPYKVIIEEETRINQVVENTFRTLVGIVGRSQIVDKNFYLPGAIDRQGLILTSDGWIITTLTEDEFSAESLVITYNKKQYPIVDTWLDQASGLFFVKIEAENLPVVELSETGELASGQKLIVPNFNRQVVLTYLEKGDFEDIASEEDLIENTETIKQKILLSQELPTEFLGSPVLNLEGKVIGLASDYRDMEKALAVNYLKPSIETLLNDRQSAKPYMGVDYINLKYALDLETFFSPERYANGALIKDIAADSPAKGILETDDIILSVDNYSINASHNLNQILLNYEIGDQIEILFLRQGEERKESLTLK